MFFLITDTYEQFTEFLLQHPSLSGRVAYSPSLGYVPGPGVLILIKDSRKTNCYHNIISLNRRNPHMAFIDYDDYPTWESQASLVMSDTEYVRMYNAHCRKHITFSARITDDHQIKVTFPERETAFILQFTI